MLLIDWTPPHGCSQVTLILPSFGNPTFQVSFDGGASVEVMVAGGKEKSSRKSSEVALGSNSCIIVSGLISHLSFPKRYCKITFQIYNPTTDTWRPATSFELPAFGSGGGANPWDYIYLFLLSLDQVVLLVHVVIFVFGSLFVLSLDRVVLCSMLLFLSLALSLDQVLLVLDVKLIF